MCIAAACWSFSDALSVCGMPCLLCSCSLQPAVPRGCMGSADTLGCCVQPLKAGQQAVEAQMQLQQTHTEQASLASDIEAADKVRAEC